MNNAGPLAAPAWTSIQQFVVAVTDKFTDPPVMEYAAKVAPALESDTDGPGGGVLGGAVEGAVKVAADGGGAVVPVEALGLDTAGRGDGGA